MLASGVISRARAISRERTGGRRKGRDERILALGELTIGHPNRAGS